MYKIHKNYFRFVPIRLAPIRLISLDKMTNSN